MEVVFAGDDVFFLDGEQKEKVYWKPVEVCACGHIYTTCTKCYVKDRVYRKRNLTGICIHRNRRTICKQCKIEGIGGGGICIHLNVRSRCVTCKASKFIM